MKQKIKKMFMVALSVAILGMSVSALPASAAQGNRNGHEHTWILDKSEFVAYTNAAQFTHQVKIHNFYHCSSCKETMDMMQLVSEPHSPDPETLQCACGYIVH